MGVAIYFQASKEQMQMKGNAFCCFYDHKESPWCNIARSTYTNLKSAHATLFMHQYYRNSLSGEKYVDQDNTGISQRGKTAYSFSFFPQVKNKSKLKSRIS